MVVTAFPPVDNSDENGLLAIGGDLEVETLLLAYSEGIFPWPLDPEYLTWFAPPQRAVLFLEDFHISQSLKRNLRRTNLHFKFNKNIEQVIEFCAALTNRGNQLGTWIIPEMIPAYIALHQAGYCHSCEAYDGDQLVGGLYGVAIGGMFAGESMFYRQPNASKLALCFLVDHLQKQKVEWIDCQMMTPLMESFGAVEIDRAQFTNLLKKALNADPKIVFPKA
jgi:leucyl/phenylalanyl-tRNA---protein transferase